MLKNIDYLEYDSSFKKAFTQSFLNVKPCIIKGCIPQWEAINWNLNILRKISSEKSKCGNLHYVHIYDPKTDKWYVCNPANIPQIRKKLEIDCLEYQAQEWLFSLYNPEMLDQINIPSPLSNPKWLDLIPLSLRPVYPRLLIGYANTGSQLHIDVCNTANWMGLVQGIKKWFVVNPEEGFKIKEFLGKFIVDTSRLEEKVASYYKFELKAGELLYLPPKWLHQVHNLEDSIAITNNLFNLFEAGSYCLNSLIVT